MRNLVNENSHYNDEVKSFVMTNYRYVRDGQESYIYSKENLELVENELKKHNINYSKKEEDGYWVLKKRRVKYGNSEKEEKQKVLLQY